jgi:hypothetical protein
MLPDDPQFYIVASIAVVLVGIAVMMVLVSELLRDTLW